MTIIETAVIPAARPQRITLTGSAGAIGQIVGPALLQRGHFVRGFDCRAALNLNEAVVGNLVDPAAVARAVTDVDTVIHLAATPDVHDFVTMLVPNNIIGTYHVLEQARAAGVKRVVLASTFRVVGDMPDSAFATAATPPAPRDYYALTKACAEQMGNMAAARGLQVIVARLGWLPRNDRGAEAMARNPLCQALYLSHNDCRNFFIRAVEQVWPVHTAQLCAVVYVFSGDPACRYDPSPAQALLGYRGQDVFPRGLDFPFTLSVHRNV
jgi:uronate dehydrogenase